MEQLNEGLKKRVSELIDELEGLEPESKEYETVSKNLEILYRVLIDEHASEWKADADFNRIELEKEQKIDRYVTWGLRVLEFGVPLMFYGYWYKTGLRFEQDGTISSLSMRNIFGRLAKPK